MISLLGLHELKWLSPVSPSALKFTDFKFLTLNLENLYGQCHLIQFWIGAIASLPIPYPQPSLCPGFACGCVEALDLLTKLGRHD